MNDDHHHYFLLCHLLAKSGGENALNTEYTKNSSSAMGSSHWLYYGFQSGIQYVFYKNTER
jgi:hypothetical protein